MKKFLILVAMVSLLATIVAVPALAQRNDDFRFDNDRFDGGFFFNGFDNNDFDNDGVTQEIGQEIDESGDFSADFSVTQTGDNSNQCAPALQFGNTGNFQNAQGALQYASTADDIEFEGGSFEFTPEQAVECTQAVQQSAAASG